VEEKDSICRRSVRYLVDSLVLKDTVKSELVSLPSDLDYIPADETPELIADRLGCLQQTIELSYTAKYMRLLTTSRFATVTIRKWYYVEETYFPLFERKIKRIQSA